MGRRHLAGRRQGYPAGERRTRDTAFMRQRPAVALLGCLTAIDAISIDSYMPALPTLQHEFHADAAAAQSTLSVFLIGIAAGQAFWGPLSDRFGRRSPLLLGLIAYLGGSLLAAAAPDLAVLLAARLIQAVGASAGLVIARAVVTDAWPAEETPRLYSLMMQVLGLTALVSPLIGGLLLTAGSWRLIFLMLAAAGGLCALWTMGGLPETYPPGKRNATSSGPRPAEFRLLFQGNAFLWSTATAALALATMFVLLAGSPFIFVRQFGWSSLTFSVLYSLTSIAFVAVCQVNNRLLRSITPQRLLASGLAIQLVLALVFLLFALQRDVTAWPLAILIIALTGLLGIILGNAVAVAMRHAPAALLGSSAAAIGVAQFLASAAIAPLSTAAHTYFSCSVALTCVGGAAATLVCAWFARRAMRT